MTCFSLIELYPMSSNSSVAFSLGTNGISSCVGISNWGWVSSSRIGGADSNCFSNDGSESSICVLILRRLRSTKVSATAQSVRTPGTGPCDKLKTAISNNRKAPNNVSRSCIPASGN